jgi:hypothetical protein
MKHFTLLAFAAAFTFSAHAQVIFQSGFEDWTGAAPDDWMGSKTNIAASDVLQVTDNPHSGTYAVQLVNATTSHKRFTTGPLTVEDGVTYTVTFWVRGEGEIRLGLFDGRPGNGYATYTSYVDVTGNTWQEVELTMAAANDTTEAEFILSVVNTVAPEHIVVDDVTIEEGGTVDPPVDATITEIQQTAAPDGNSPMVGSMVNTGGMITAISGTSGYFVQDGSGAWSGIYVFSDPGSLMIGDMITLTGTVAEFNGQTQLTGITNLVTVSSGGTPTPTVITAQEANTEPFESVLVQVVSVTVQSSGPFGQYTVADGSGTVLVDDVIFAYPFEVGNTYNITGVLQYAFSEWRILPRMMSDVAIVSSVPSLSDLDITIFPNPATDQLSVDLTSMDGSFNYELIDATGRIVRSDRAINGINTIDVSRLNTGIYVFKLIGEGSAWSSRIVKQ